MTNMVNTVNIVTWWLNLTLRSRKGLLCAHFLGLSLWSLFGWCVIRWRNACLALGAIICTPVDMALFVRRSGKGATRGRVWERRWRWVDETLVRFEYREAALAFGDHSSLLVMRLNLEIEKSFTEEINEMATGNVFRVVLRAFKTPLHSESERGMNET
jgi:hypothetical protein